MQISGWREKRNSGGGVKIDNCGTVGLWGSKQSAATANRRENLKQKSTSGTPQDS